MNTEHNKAVVRRFFTAFEEQDYGALQDILSPELPAYVHGDTEPAGRDELLEIIRGWNTAFSNTRFTVEDQVAEGDLVACRVTMTAVHSGGEFQGIAPAGLPVSSQSLTLERVVDDRISEHRVVTNWAEVLQQLAPAAAGTSAAR